MYINHSSIFSILEVYLHTYHVRVPLILFFEFGGHGYINGSIDSYGTTDGANQSITELNSPDWFSKGNG